MRIGVRIKSQKHGIGKKLMNYLFLKYPNHLSLDVNTDNAKAISFYQRIGMESIGTYTSPNNVEFTQFETPKGFKPPQIETA